MTTYPDSGITPLHSATGGLVRRKFTPVAFTNVTIQDRFWTPRITVNREQTIPFEYLQCKQTGRIEALKLNWKPGMRPVPHIFWDSDIAKWIEAASYSIAAYPDAALDTLIDELIALLAASQQPDGYLNSHYTVVEPQNRWTNLRDNHELYCAGHLIEAAVAHYQATGKRSLLDVACRYANYIDTVFGANPDQKHGYPGHQEIELALVKLYHVTNDARYLRLSKYFIDERGRQPHYYDQEAWARGDDPANYWAKSYEYNQSHIPAREQTRITGHAVRAMYFYSAMADLAGETGDESLLRACETLWTDLTTKRMYLTGGIGPSRHNEGFTRPYDLPNETAYAEACAAIGLVFWNHRLLQIDCDSRYADILERALYNGVLSGVALDGKTFFYENPLASLGDHHRQEWFDVACCPPNLARLLASLGQYVYAQSEADAAVHLYIQGSGKLEVAGQPITIHQQTNYPWNGTVQLRLEVGDRPLDFGLRLRIPGWCRAATLRVNGEPVDIPGCLENGYARIQRTWHNGDEVTLDLAMPVERVYAHPDVREDAGKVALQRGPIVYCLEEVDNAVPLQRIRIAANADFASHFDPELLDGVVVVTGQALAAGVEGWANTLYSTTPSPTTPAQFQAIPYYAWDNRQPGQMRVWVEQA
jgi:DUF1680 family protein